MGSRPGRPTAGTLRRVPECAKTFGRRHRKCLVYLTRSGEDPRMRVPVDFVRLSHSVHICRLLQATLESPGRLSRQLCGSLYCSIVKYWRVMMTDSMTLMVAFFHENDHLARARALREALDQFETRMPERIEGRICPNCRPRHAPRRAGVDFNAFRPPETPAFTAWAGNATGPDSGGSRIGLDSAGGVWQA